VVAAKRREPRPFARADADPRRRDEEGRLHLVVQPDPRGGAPSLALADPVFDDAWQNDLALAAASAAHAALAAAHSREGVAALGRTIMDATSKLIDGLLSKAGDRPVACQSGCAHCCYQAVGVSVPEALALEAHVRTTRTPEELEALVARVRATDDRTRGLSSAERLSPELPCPFLDEGTGRCGVYEARPLACRGTNSLDAEACAELLREPAARAAFVAGERTFPCYLEPLRAFHALSAGLQLALDELHGLETKPLELTAAMRILFDDPARATEEWLAGRDPFQAARGADSTDNPRIAALSGRRRT